ncbi:hypothetical protein B0H14DRAFT_2868179 [Mycena olivaceomarginata]|nr:hypothetical protein B0H14DRAFT_2868179 [Mycena olivaceomarginata]
MVKCCALGYQSEQMVASRSPMIYPRFSRAVLRGISASVPPRSPALFSRASLSQQFRPGLRINEAVANGFGKPGGNTCDRLGEHEIFRVGISGGKHLFPQLLHEPDMPARLRSETIQMRPPHLLVAQHEGIKLRHLLVLLLRGSARRGPHGLEGVDDDINIVLVFPRPQRSVFPPCLRLPFERESPNFDDLGVRGHVVNDPGLLELSDVVEAGFGISVVAIERAREFDL